MKIILSAILLAMAAARAEPGHTFAPLTPGQLARIDAAAPAEAPAKPLKPRRVLVFYRTEGFVHDSIPYGNEALQRLGTKTGAYQTVLSDDMAMFESSRLAEFDAVIFQNTTLLKFENPEHRKALLQFVRSGKGLVGIHAGIDNFPTWPEAQAMIGGVFHSHPWISKDISAVKLDDPGHVVNQAFGGRGFWVKEEIYQIIGPYGRDRQHVLMSLDMSKPENQRDPVKAKIVRTDNDFPIGWVKEESKGRIFFSSLGHNKETFMAPEILRHYLAGIQYALGDLSADATPTSKLSPPPVPALAPDDIKILNP